VYEDLYIGLLQNFYVIEFLLCEKYKILQLLVHSPILELKLLNNLRNLSTSVIPLFHLSVQDIFPSLTHHFTFLSNQLLSFPYLVIHPKSFHQMDSCLEIIS